MENQRFEALSRICLNNWHYIKHRTAVAFLIRQRQMILTEV